MAGGDPAGPLGDYCQHGSGGRPGDAASSQFVRNVVSGSLQQGQRPSFWLLIVMTPRPYPTGSFV